MKKMKEKVMDVVPSEKNIHHLRERGWDDKLIRKSHTHGLVFIALVLIIGSPIISATSADTQNYSPTNSENKSNLHDASQTGYAFLGLVRDLNDEGNPITCYAVIFFYTNLSHSMPKTINVISEKQISIDNPFYYGHIHFLNLFGINITIIYGGCENIEINQFFK